MQAVHNDVYTSKKVPAPRGASAVLVVWLVVATTVVATGLFARPPAQILPLSVGGLTALTLLLLASSHSGRQWARSVSRVPLAWFHAWRVVPGAAFLVLYAQGSLPWAFAVPGGIGDIAVGLTAPIAAWVARRPGNGARAAYIAWSIFGFLDLARVAREAFACSLADLSSMHLLRELPLGLLPTFAVPLTFVAHALAFRRSLMRA